MRWVVRIELEEDGPEANADFGAICIERARLEDAAGLGLTLERQAHYGLPTEANCD